MNESKFFRRDKGHNRFGNDASGSDPWAYVSHEVSIDPIDDSGINVSNLEQRRNLWVPGTAIGRCECMRGLPSARFSLSLQRTGGGQRLQPVFCIVCQASIALCRSIRRRVIGSGGRGGT